MKELVVDLGCGRNCRGDVCVVIDFNWFNPYYNPRPYDEIVASTKTFNDKVIADLNYPLPFRDGAFTGVIIVHTLEHLLCPYQTLLEVKRILKKNGWVKIVVPNSMVNPADKFDDGHIYSFTPWSIARLVAKVFKVVKVETILKDHDIYVEAIKTD